MKLDENIDLTLYSVFNPDLMRKWRPAEQYKVSLIRNNPLFVKKQPSINSFFVDKILGRIPGTENSKISAALGKLANTTSRRNFANDCNYVLFKVFRNRVETKTKIVSDDNLEFEIKNTRRVSEEEIMHYYDKTMDNPGLFRQVYDDSGFSDAIFKRNYTFKISNLYTKINSINNEITYLSR